MASSYCAGYALIYGGNGALGSGCVSHFKAHHWWVASVDICKSSLNEDEQQTKEAHLIFQEDRNSSHHYNVNREADVNILIHIDKDLEEQQNEVKNAVKVALKGNELDSIICVAGGFAFGNVLESFLETTKEMWRQNVWPSLISVSIAASFLAEAGLLCLTGADAALQGTPATIGYGLSKAAIHQLVKSLACENTGLPKDVLCVGLLPVTIDTIVNRQIMPEADISAWTPTKYIAEMLFKWSLGKERPKNGSLARFVTQNFNTDVSFI